MLFEEGQGYEKEHRDRPSVSKIQKTNHTNHKYKYFWIYKFNYLVEKIIKVCFTTKVRTDINKEDFE